MIKKTAILFVVLLSFSANAAVFHWDLAEKDRLELVKTAKIDFLINGEIQRRYEERNIIDLTCYEEKENHNGVKGVFSVFTKENGESVFKLTDKKYSEFIINANGSYKVGEKYLFPNLRHIPTFPEKEINVGDKWSFPAELYLDNFSIVLGLQLNCEYELKETGKINGTNVATILYRFEIDKDFRNAQGKYPDLPAKIAGSNDGILLWDMDKNRLINATDHYRIVFAFLVRGNLQTYEFNMNIDTSGKIYNPVAQSDKEEGKNAIEKALPKNSGITVDTNENGIVLKLGDILFDFDKANLKLSAIENLDKAVQVIKDKYPDREIVVEGHTDNIGRAEYNQKLSEKRAENVADYVKKGVGHDKLSFRGFGSSNPVAENSTEQGRMKNRRVELTIKLK